MYNLVAFVIILNVSSATPPQSSSRTQATGDSGELIAQGGHHHAQKTEAAKPPRAVPAKPQLKKAGEARIGDRTICAVTGDEFTIDADSPKAEHGGKTHYFCCEDCVDQFKTDPAKFLPKP